VQKVGEAWKTGRYITLSLTIMYHIDRERGQVYSLTLSCAYPPLSNLRNTATGVSVLHRRAVV
jgi:hypothetical protein